MIDLVDIWLLEDGRPVPGESVIPPPALGAWINGDWDVFNSADSANLDFQQFTVDTLHNCHSSEFSLIAAQEINIAFDIDVIANDENLEFFLIASTGDVTPISNKITVLGTGIKSISGTLIATSSSPTASIYIVESAISVLTTVDITNFAVS